ncbi:MAG: ribonuclease T2 [Tateyamaria sp.]|nr:ribonuclease T2 [Tateyamaria sp.]
MRAHLFWILITLGLTGPAMAQQHKSGEFDYYVMALSWSPNWCALSGDAKGSDQCDARHDHGWILHGLWPQYHRGFPEYCRSNFRAPSRSQTNAMADIIGTGGLAWHQWKKHGVCSGLSPADYYARSREAYASVTRPAIFRKLDKPIKLPASVVEAAWLKDNPDLEADGLTITCKQGHIQEARICLSRDLAPVPCGQDVVRDCTMRDAVFDPIR